MLVLLCVHMAGCSVGTTVRTHGWLECWYCCAYTWLPAVLVPLCVHMAGCNVGTTVRTHGWLQCWYCCAYTWLAAVLVLLCVHMAGCSVGTSVRTHGWIQCWYCCAYTWLAAVRLQKNAIGLTACHYTICSISNSSTVRYSTVQTCAKHPTCFDIFMPSSGSYSRNRSAVMPREKVELRCSGSLTRRIVLVTDVSRQPIGLIFRVQEPNESL